MGYKSLEELERAAIKVYDGMTVVHPQQGQQVLHLHNVSNFDGRYSFKNGTLAFGDDGTLYCIPMTRNVLAILKQADFRQDYFYVPFSNSDYPLEDGSRWINLQKIAQASFEQDFLDDCEEHCSKSGIGVLKESILRNCICIPSYGMRVRFPHNDTIVYPILRSQSLDYNTAEFLGKYNYDKDVVIFVYRDGKTYITKGLPVLNELRAKGYKQKSMYVPLVGSEEILDEDLRAKWFEICKG